MDTSKISFSEQYSDYIATVIVHGLSLPHRNFDPLVKIWAMLRRRFREWYGVDIVGIFIYDDVKSIIACNFYLNCAEDGQGENKRISTFEKATPIMMQTFEEVLVAFLENENGFARYAKMAAVETTKQNDYIRCLNNFLKEIHLRTDKDDRRTEKEKKRSKAE